MDIQPTASANNPLQKQKQATTDLLLEQAGLGIGYYDIDGMALLFNAVAAAHLDGLPEDFVGKSIGELFDPATASIYLDRIKMAANSESSQVYEDWVTFPSGKICFLSTFSRVKDLSDEVIGVQIVSQDITDRKQMEEALSQSEERLRTVVKNMPIMVNATDQEFQFVMWNQECERVTGYTAEEIVGNPQGWELLYPDPTYREQMMASLAEHLTAEGFRDWEWEWDLISKDGQRKTIAWSNVSKQYPVAGWTDWGIGVDVTERKRAEAALRQTNAELSRRVEELSALNQIAQAMATMTDLPAALEMVSQTMTRLFGAYGTGIGLLTEDRSALRVFTHAPRDKSFPSKAGRLFPIAGNSLVQTVIKKAETVCLYQIQTDPDLAYLREALQAPDVTGLMSLPLLSYGKVIGTITVTTDQTDRRFRPVEIQLAKTVAGTVANAVENARLFQAEQRQRQIAESLQEVAMILNSTLDTETILAKIFEQLGRVIPHHGGGLLLRDRNCLVLTKAIGEPAKSRLGDKILLNSQHPVARVFKAKQMMIINDGGKEPHWWAPDVIRSWIGAPLCIGQKAIGVLTVDNFAETDAYREEEGQILQIFANQAATAIENARLYEQVQQDAHTKAVLLQEVNHRVKNNLMGISGMLYATRRYAEQSGIQEPCLDLIKDLAYRIDGLATVHNMLANAEWSRLSLHRLTAEIIEVALQALPPGKETFPRIISANPVWITPRQANSLAMIINELTTNTLKYALNERQSAQITVHIAQRGGINLFEFRDDGPGYSEEVLRLEGHNVGMYLIRNLVQSNLNGQVELQNDNGAAIYIRFPAEI